MKTYKWCAIDAEGDVGDKGLLGVAFYSDKIQAYLTEAQDIVAALEDHARDGYTFLAHNAQYDIPVIFNQLRIDVKVIYYNDRFNRGEWRYDKDKSPVQIWDTFALSGNISLMSLGKSMGLPKHSTPQKLLGIDPNRHKWTCEKHAIGECEECYAVRDAEIVYRFMEDMTNVLAAWGIAPHRRISGLAIRVWQKLDKPAPIDIKSNPMKHIARHAYKGGRVETFKLGTFHNVYSADVCSMYPSVMVTTPYPDPTTLVYETEVASTDHFINNEGVIHCDISVPNMYIPPLAYTYKGERIYPVGRLRGYWTLLEIRYALSIGCRLNKVYDVCYATANRYPCTQFVNTLWTMRETYERANDSRSYFAKLFMNNLYGRWGIQDDLKKKEIWPAPHYTEMSQQVYSNWSIVGNRMWLENEQDEHLRNRWCNVMWAAQTTAAARVVLHKYMMQQGNNILYCDTDSVFSTAPIVGLGEGLGSLRDPQEYDMMVIAAPKMYAVKHHERDMPDWWHTGPCEKHHLKRCQECRWQAKAKGVPKAMALGYIRNGVAEYQQPIKPVQALTRHINAGTWVDIKKMHYARPHRRHPVTPDALSQKDGFSDTRPSSVNWLLSFSGKR